MKHFIFNIGLLMAELQVLVSFQQNKSILKLKLKFFLPECNCNTQGVDKVNHSEELDLTCDAESGKCHCRCDVDGDKCDACVAGHHTFPDCHGKFDLKKK